MPQSHHWGVILGGLVPRGANQETVMPTSWECTKDPTTPWRWECVQHTALEAVSGWEGSSDRLDRTHSAVRPARALGH